MGRTILCPHCKSTFNEDILKERNSETVCLVCGKSLLSGDESDTPPEKKETKTYYYYADSADGAEALMPILSSRKSAPIYTFEATDVEDAKRQLKKIVPNSALFRKPSDKVSCPICGSTEVQLVPKKSGLFSSGGVTRACVRCKRIF